MPSISLYHSRIRSTIVALRSRPTKVESKAQPETSGRLHLEWNMSNLIWQLEQLESLAQAFWAFVYMLESFGTGSNLVDDGGTENMEKSNKNFQVFVLDDLYKFFCGFEFWIQMCWLHALLVSN